MERLIALVLALCITAIVGGLALAAGLAAHLWFGVPGLLIGIMFTGAACIVILGMIADRLR